MFKSHDCAAQDCNNMDHPDVYEAALREMTNDALADQASQPVTAGEWTVIEREIRRRIAAGTAGDHWTLA